MFFRAVLAAFILSIAVSLAAQQPTQTRPVLETPAIGPGAVQLGGSWQFHLGDDPNWASPALDDSSWEPIDIATSWGSQNHPGYVGFAWYRRHLQIHSTGASTAYSLLMPPVDDAYEFYWNGTLIGSYGKLPPHPRWYYTSLPRTFAVPSATAVTIAIRVWKSPPLFVDSGSLGGINGPPMLGVPETIAAKQAAQDSQSIHQTLYDYTLLILYGIVTIFSLLLWMRTRKIRLFLWLALFTATPVLLAILQGLFPIPVRYGVGRGLNQPIYALNHISLWFLLLWLLRLNGRRRLVFWTRALAISTFAAAIFDGALAPFWGSAGQWMQSADAVLTTIILVAQFYPFLLILVGMRQKLDSAHWVVAISALVSQIIDIIADLSAAGQRFTHWTFFQKVNTPLFIVHGVAFEATNLVTIVLFISILYAVHRYDTEQQARQNLLEREIQSAREIQRLLIPEMLPSLEGFAVTSAYRPALEVGGDFFQLTRDPAGATIVALGDVSGKGLKAAMTVSLIVGILRSLSELSYSPLQMLQAMNHCLHGRLQGGFVTAAILRLQTDGTITLANAGHLPPFLNEEELQIEGSLPLGLSPASTYNETSIHLKPGDQLSVYTDGLLEARSVTGELYGFDRLRVLFASRPSAQEASEAAIAFGQNDDITVLTFTRLAEGEQSTTSLTATLIESDATL